MSVEAAGVAMAGTWPCRDRPLTFLPLPLLRLQGRGKRQARPGRKASLLQRQSVDASGDRMPAPTA